MSLTKTVNTNIDVLYDMCKDKYFLELKYILPIINDYKQRKIRNINTAIKKLEKINITKKDCIKFNENLFNMQKSIILKKYIQKIREKINKTNIIIPEITFDKINKTNIIIHEITFDKILEEFITMNYNTHKIVNMTEMNNKKIKNLKKNIKEKTILLKLHKENKDVCSIYTNKLTFQMTNKFNYKSIIDRLLTNEFKCCVCFDTPLNKASFYICEICNIITCKNCLNEIYMKKKPDCTCCENDHNEIAYPQCKSKIENKVKNMLVEYLGFRYFTNFKKFCVVYKKNDVKIVRDVIENKLICLIYSGIAIEKNNIRFKDIDKINFEKIINEQNPTSERKPFILELEED